MSKKTILFSVLFWVLVFVEVSVIGFNPRFATMGEHGFTLNAQGLMFHFFGLVIISLLLGYLYFRKSKNEGAKTGLRIGVAFLVIGSVLDALITVPFFVKSYSLFFSKGSLWVGYAVTFVTLIVFAEIMKRLRSRVN